MMGGGLEEMGIVKPEKETEIMLREEILKLKKENKELKEKVKEQEKENKELKVNTKEEEKTEEEEKKILILKEPNKFMGNENKDLYEKVKIIKEENENKEIERKNEKELLFKKKKGQEPIEKQDKEGVMVKGGSKKKNITTSTSTFNQPIYYPNNSSPPSNQYQFNQSTKNKNKSPTQSPQTWSSYKNIGGNNSKNSTNTIQTSPFPLYSTSLPTKPKNHTSSSSHRTIENIFNLYK
jgi:hypothetical protein